jgi:hypothetical protein
MFRGKYKTKNQYGQPIFYQKGDAVLDQGKVYSCLVSTNFSPLQQPTSWKITDISNPYGGANSPINPIENQIWISDSGISYIYYKDSNGYQWIET